MTRPQGQPYDSTDQATTWSAGWLALVGALAVTAAAWSVQVFRLPLWVPAAAAGGGVFVAVMAATRTALRRRVTAQPARPGMRFTAIVVGGVVVGGWMTWVAVAGPTPPALVTIGVLALGGWAVSAYFGPATPPPVQPLAPVVPARDPLITKWVEIINSVVGIKPPGSVVVQTITHWPGDTGYTVRGEFPLGVRATFQSILFDVAGIAGALRLPKGCPIKVDEGPHQGSFEIKVSTVNDLANRIPYPTDLIRPHDIRDDFPIGDLRDKQRAMVDIYQSSVVIAGRRGGGKTVLLHGFAAHAVQATNALLWIIDLNGGSMAAPWTAAYAEGEIPHPVVDWVATTPAEAIRVATVGLQIAKARKSRYQRLMNQQNVDVLPLADDVPAIIIIVDEGAEVLGEEATDEAKRAAQLLRELQRIGRAMCVNVVFSVMRGVNTHVPTSMKKLCLVKVVMPVDDDSEVSYLLDWTKGVRAADLTEPGAGFVRRGNRPPENFKSYAFLPNDIRRIAVAASPWQPRLDAWHLGVAGPTYTQRWDRDDTRLWVRQLAGDLDDGDLSLVPDLDVEANVRGEIPMAVMAAGLERFAEQFRANLAGQRLVVGLGSNQQQQEDTVTEPQQDPARPQETGPELVVRMVRDAGPAGVKTEALFTAAEQAGLTQRRGTVNDWLRTLADDGLVESKPREFGYWVPGPGLRAEAH